MSDGDAACPICSAPTEPAGIKASATRPYHLRRCAACGFAYVADPDVHADPYDDAYYHGKGADPLVDYVFDADHPGETIRRLEWRGTLAVVESIKPVGPQTRWLDYGCGTGGFARWLSRRGFAVSGYDQGRGAALARERGLAVLDDAQLDDAGPFDVVTAIEVLEHVGDPQRAVDRIARLLAPGGIFFYTTGNAARHAGSLAGWSYVVPEIHVAFFEPRTTERMLRAAGLQTVEARWSRGFSDIVAYKILKNLHVHRSTSLLAALPWQWITRAVDRIAGVSEFPIGIKPAT